MADSTILPGVRARLVAPDGTTTREFYRFFSALSVTASLPGRVDDLTVRVDDLDKRVDVLEHGGGAVRTIMGLQSVKVVGPLEDGSVQLALAGDVISAPALSFYGALAEYGKEWQTFSGNFAALDNGDDTQSLDLADLADSGTGTALVKITRDAKGRISGTSAATTTDLAEGSNLYYTDARADARITVAKADPDGIASLVDGKLDPGQLPALAITETFVVNTEAAMLALDCQQGDVAVRTDLNKSLILTASPASTLANWQELLTPTGGVSSFNGRTGSVTPASGDYTPAQVGAEPVITAGATAQYWRGDKTWRDFATDVRATVLTGLSVVTNAAIAATDTVLQAFGKLQAQITARVKIAGDTMTGDLRVERSGTSTTDTPTVIASNTNNTGATSAREARFDLISDTLLARLFWRRAAPVTLGLYIDLDDGEGPKTRLRFTEAGWNVEGVPLSVDGSAGSYRLLNWTTNGSNRWAAFADNSSESGGDTGSNWYLNAYHDDGSFSFNAIAINRVTGVATFKGNLVAPNTANTGWQALAPQNGWSNLGGYATLACRKVGSFVTVRGVLSGGTVTDGTVVCTLPVGFRPPATLVVAATSNSTDPTARFAVATNGQINILKVTSSSFLSLSMDFYAD